MQKVEQNIDGAIQKKYITLPPAFDQIGMVSQIVQAVIEAARQTLENDLWEAADIANYMKLSKKTVQNHVINNDGFPKPVLLATGGRRWIASEVRSWVLKRR